MESQLSKSGKLNRTDMKYIFYELGIAGITGLISAIDAFSQTIDIGAADNPPVIMGIFLGLNILRKFLTNYQKG